MASSRKEIMDSAYVTSFTDEGFKINFGIDGKSEEILKGYLNELLKDDLEFRYTKELSFRHSERT